MAGKKRNTTDFPNITRSQFARILKKVRDTKYVRCPYLAIRDASLLAFEFLFKTRVSEGVGRVFPEDRKDRQRSKFLDRYEGTRLDDFEISTVKGREVLRCRFRVLKRGCRKKICENCGSRNSLKANYCGECGSTLAEVEYDSRLTEHYVWDSVRLDDPFAYYIIEWLDFLRKLETAKSSSVGYYSSEGLADLPKTRDNEPYPKALAGHSACRCYGPFHA